MYLFNFQPKPIEPSAAVIRASHGVLGGQRRGDRGPRKFAPIALTARHDDSKIEYLPPPQAVRWFGRRKLRSAALNKVGCLPIIFTAGDGRSGAGEGKGAGWVDGGFR